jgi:hypothetical protein
MTQQDIRDLCSGFRDGLRSILGGKLHGVYLFGAVAFPGPAPTGDIDFHVILGQQLTGAERAALERLHVSLGGVMDGYYLLLEDARQDAPPRSQMWAGAVDRSWALHRQHIRSGRCIVLHGPDPLEIYPAPSWTELEEALLVELQYVEEHLSDYPAYCILNLCRLIYSFETGDVVVSKASSAAWAVGAIPEWSGLVELARKSYAGRATAADESVMLEGVADLHRMACRRIEQGRAGREAWSTGSALDTGA